MLVYQRVYVGFPKIGLPPNHRLLFRKPMVTSKGILSLKAYPPAGRTEVLPRKLTAEAESQRLLSWEHLDIGENSSTSLSPTLKSVMFRGSKKKS